jgi:shikimate kinase
MKTSNIVLIGMPGSGKSTVGVLLAKYLGLDFVDTDILICRREKTTLQDILDTQGLDAFLAAEDAAVRSRGYEDCVVATGGSVVLSDDAMAHLAQNATIVFLDVALPVLQQRITNLESRGIAFAPGQTLADIYDQRLPLYRRWADVTIRCPEIDGHNMTEFAVGSIMTAVR